MVIPVSELESGLANFDDYYQSCYQDLMLKKLGFENLSSPEKRDLVSETIILLRETQVEYHNFFAQLAGQFNPAWRGEAETILQSISLPKANWGRWGKIYHYLLNNLPEGDMDKVSDCLDSYNPKTALLRPVIESVWEAIAHDNNWQPFEKLVTTLQQKIGVREKLISPTP
jgi:uncharacterized protein YdiU (UPF0061 family)